MPFFQNMNYAPECNVSRLKWDLAQKAVRVKEVRQQEARFQVLPPELFDRPEEIWLEVGAGTGAFFADMAVTYPDRFFIAMERCKLRGQRLVKKVARTAVPNFVGYRGNVIPALTQGVPDARLERIYILYPCPWPKNSQRKNRWYLHPLMREFLRTLKPGGLLIWASDQKFYIDEARFVCESVHGMTVLEHGEIRPNAHNDLARFPLGRSKFEQDFLQRDQPCYELIVKIAPQSALSRTASTS